MNKITKKIEIIKRDLKRYYLNMGLSSYDVAKIYNCNASAIQRRLKEYNIPLIHKREEIKISKERLYDLYINKRLSTYKIAELYRCDNKTIYRKLKIAGIKTRPKKIINIPKKRLEELYLKRRLSIYKIAKIHNCCPWVIWDKLKKCKINIRDNSDAHTHYLKKCFEGDNIKKAYMIGFRLGDLHVKKPKKNSKIIIVTGNTTKIAQVNLVKDVFGCYGHFYTKNRKGVHEVTCFLDNSFLFLLPKQDKIENWILEHKNYFFSFLAGYTDAEGCIKINKGMASYRLGSYDKNLLKQVHEKLKELYIYSNYNLETKKGSIFGGVIQNGDFWRVGIYRKDMLLKFFDFIEPYIKHSSKMEDLKRAKENILERNRMEYERKKVNHGCSSVYQ